MMLRSPAASKNIQSVLKRFSSSQVAKQDSNDGQISKTKVKNGITVVTTDIPSLHANVMLLAKAGSRYENPSSNLGISHCLRAGALLSSDKDTAWHYTQLLGNFGGDFSVSGTREHVSYNLKCGRRVWRDLITEVVAPSVCRNSFFWWELDQISKSMKTQLAHANTDPAFNLIEAVHQASFRGGLGNSVISPEGMIGSHTTEMAQEFFNSNYNLANMVLAGNGVNHDELCDVAETAFELPSRGSTGKPSEFISSEVRLHERGDAAHVGLSFCGSALNDQDAIAIAVVQNILDSSSNVKRQSGRTDRIGSAVGKKVDGVFATSAYNVNYSDAGLIGVYIKSDPASIGHAVSAVREELGAMAEGGISDKEVAAGKNSLKSGILMQAECSESVLSDVAVQTSLLGGAVSPQEISAKIDAVTTSQVARVAKKVFGGKKSLAAVGDITNCPYLADL
uniref:cytochrome b-c1 complex subunit 2, mitochondrial-like n=1 Tax=Styela clava TaxID=7725 RepID=UPI001939B3FE|nr:cytochrome b-c1 complex subunit 2, mitochondrial-like [Styela clava]